MYEVEHGKVRAMMICYSDGVELVSLRRGSLDRTTECWLASHVDVVGSKPGRVKRMIYKVNSFRYLAWHSALIIG